MPVFSITALSLTIPCLPSLQITRLFYAKTAVKQVKPGVFYYSARHFSCRTPPCCHPLHPGVESWYIRVLRRVTWGCLRNYVLVFTKKREDFCGMKNRISSIYYLPHSFLHLFIRLFYMLFQKQKEDSTLILNHISKAPYFRSDRGVIEENVLYHSSDA